MNRRPSGSLLLSKAIAGFLQYKAAEGLSPNTLQQLRARSQVVAGIRRRCARQPDHDRHVAQTTSVWLRTDYKPRRITGDRSALCRRRPFATSTSALSAFFTWASREFELAQSDESHPRSRSLKRHPSSRSPKKKSKPCSKPANPATKPRPPIAASSPCAAPPASAIRRSS